MEHRNGGFVAAMVVMGLAMPGFAQLPEIRIDGDDIVVVGCVQEGATPTLGLDQHVLFWTTGEVMLAYAEAAIWQDEGTELPNPFFYWIDDYDSLSEHVAQMVEVQGSLEDFEEGTIEVSHDDGFTSVKMDVDGEEEMIRVPSAWLGAIEPQDEGTEREFDIVVRKLNVENVEVLGACSF